MPGEHNDVIYNLGSHIIDQAYVLFGMPDRVGCRCWDMRGIGVDEAVSSAVTCTSRWMLIAWRQFVMDLYYPRPTPTSPPLIVTLRASILSPLPKQLRFLIKGSKGSFIKYGLDPQEGYLKKLGAGGGVKVDGYGEEPEEDWGTVWVAEEKDGAEFRRIV
jgi:predicted dehydrogenase